MSHFAVIAPPLYSHFSALEALAQALLALGHRITFFQQPEARALLSDPRIGFVAVGEGLALTDRLARTSRLLAHPSGFGIIRLIDALAKNTDMLCRELPAALEKAGVDGVIADQMEPAGGLVSEALGLSFVSIACALPVNRDVSVPLAVMPFDYGTDDKSRRLYAASTGVYDWLMRRHSQVISRRAAAFGLSCRRGLHDCLSPLAQISQTIPDFDFPRQLPACFHAVGPLRSATVGESPLFQTADEKPLIFASLGTLQGHRYGLFRAISQACRQAGARLLIAHCGGLNARQTASLEAQGARTVDFTDQHAALRQAQAVITHGGLNTVMDAIATATPILAIPLAFDQPGVAARVVYSGIGRRASRFAHSRALARHLEALLSNGDYIRRQSVLQRQLARAGGAMRAAHIVDQALRTRRPVIAEVCDE